MGKITRRVLCIGSAVILSLLTAIGPLHATPSSIRVTISTQTRTRDLGTRTLAAAPAGWTIPAYNDGGWTHARQLPANEQAAVRKALTSSHVALQPGMAFYYGAIVHDNYLFRTDFVLPSGWTARPTTLTYHGLWRSGAGYGMALWVNGHKLRDLTSGGIVHLPAPRIDGYLRAGKNVIAFYWTGSATVAGLWFSAEIPAR